MEHFPIRSFRPVEANIDNPDQDRTVLRLCEGLVAVPQSALCSGPNWRPLFGLTDLGSRITTLLAGADQAKTHFVKLTHGSHVFLIAWSIPLGVAVGFCHVDGEPTEIDLDDTEGVALASPADAIYQGKHDAARWRFTKIADRWLIGNGHDANLQWRNGTLSVLGPATPPADIYDRSRVRIPPCTSFAQGVTKSIFAGGNGDQPLRVWITDAPNTAYPFNEGIYSLDTSFVDLIYNGATEIRGIAAFQNYITVHTDRQPVNLFDVDGDSTGGWKCVQTPSVANASAPNHASVGDSLGMASFYLGSDGEVYKDEAIRSGPYGKVSGRKQEIATNLGAGVWNREMQRPLAETVGHVLYDRENGLFWFFAPLRSNRGMALWCFNENNRSVTGPFRYPDAVVSTIMQGMHPALIDVSSGIGGMDIGGTFGVS